MVTFVNALRVPAEREAEFLEKWDRGAAYVRSRSGLVWTSLHRALDASGPFQFFTIAVWQSREAFEAATSTDWWRSYVSEFGFSASPTDFGASPALCGVARPGGPFQERAAQVPDSARF